MLPTSPHPMSGGYFCKVHNSEGFYRFTFFVPTEIAYSNMTRLAARWPVGRPVEIRHGILELRNVNTSENESPFARGRGGRLAGITRQGKDPGQTSGRGIPLSRSGGPGGF
jgi:hypothetical protein